MVGLGGKERALGQAAIAKINSNIKHTVSLSKLLDYLTQMHAPCYDRIAHGERAKRVGWPRHTDTEAHKYADREDRLRGGTRSEKQSGTRAHRSCIDWPHELSELRSICVCQEPVCAVHGIQTRCIIALTCPCARRLS
jgi:hypothetical protein